MTETEYQMAVQRTHNAYCKTVIRHAAITAIRRLQRKWEREISLEYLMYEKHFPITDWRDFVTAELDEERLLTACGLSVMLDNEELANALSHLSQEEREKIFLYYFLRQTQTQIGQHYGVSDIDRILVHELDKETNTRKIEILYNFVGRIDSGDKPTESISYFRQVGADVKSFAI